MSLAVPAGLPHTPRAALAPLAALTETEPGYATAGGGEGGRRGGEGTGEGSSGTEAGRAQAARNAFARAAAGALSPPSPRWRL